MRVQLSPIGRLLLGGGVAAATIATILIALAPGPALTAVALGLFGVTGVLLVSLAFLTVGESEDRERTQEATRRRLAQEAERVSDRAASERAAAHCDRPARTAARPRARRRP